MKTLDIFARAYGTAAGNLALTVLASGGVYIAGGIAPRIVQQLAAGAFMQAFRDKGRLSDVVERIPVRVVLTGDVALYGAAAVAARHTRWIRDNVSSRANARDLRGVG